MQINVRVGGVYTNIKSIFLLAESPGVRETTGGASYEPTQRERLVKEKRQSKWWLDCSVPQT